MYSYDEYYYGYDAMENAAAGVGGFFVAFLLVFYLLMLGFCIATYILQSAGLYSIAKRRGIHHPWLAWVPVGYMWVFGSISDQYQYVAKGRVKNRRKVLLGLSIAMFAIAIVYFAASFSLILDGVFGLGATMDAALAIWLMTYLVQSILLIVNVVFMYIALYDIYASCQPENSVLYLILSVFVNITMPFFIFALRKKDGGMPPRKAPEPELPEPEVVEIPTADETEE